MKNENPQIYVL